MKAEAWVFGALTIFFALITPVYWVMSGDLTGTFALILTFFLALMITGYFGLIARRIDPRPEDRVDGEIAEGAGELGFFPPYSWWPLWCALALGVMVYGVAMSAWWLVIIGFTAGAVVTCGFVFEYYRGEHAH